MTVSGHSALKRYASLTSLLVSGDGALKVSSLFKAGFELGLEQDEYLTMFCNHIKNSANCGLPTDLQNAVNLLPDFAQLAPGRYPINGDKLFALVQEVETSEQPQGHFEAHSRYLDVQYLVSGQEKIGYLAPGTHVQLMEDRLEQDDYALYSSSTPPCELILHPGMFAVFYPGELHRPCGAPGASEQIRKVVLKIKLDKEKD